MNIVDYVEQNLKTFDEAPFNEVDGLVCAWLAYIRWPEQLPEVTGWTGISLHNLYRAELFDGMFGRIYEAERTKGLFTAVAASPRFRNCKVKGYVSHFDVSEEKQFSAVTIQYGENAHFIAFRGTDSTLIGWKEDFNMVFTYPIPAQQEAERYLKLVAENTTGGLMLGGHSKGGNLAVFAAAHGEAYAHRVGQVYSYDGPGFMEELQHSRPFQDIASKVCKIVPQSSVFGMLMEENRNYRVVQSDGVGFWQHNAFSWLLDEQGFLYLPELNKNAIVFDKTVNDWLRTLSRAERERFVDTLFSLTENIDAVTFADINAKGKENYPQLINSIVNLDGESRKFVFRILGDLAKHPLQNFPDYLKLMRGEEESGNTELQNSEG